MENFEKQITFSPAWNKRSSDPSKDYGIGAVEIRFVLKGALGALQFVVGTDWYLPADQQRIKNGPHDILSRAVQPRGWDIGYHAPTPQYEGQSPMDCSILGGQQCYYDGSGLQADKFVPEFLAGGSDAVWAMLEQRYYNMFTDNENRNSERGGE